MFFSTWYGGVHWYKFHMAAKKKAQAVLLWFPSSLAETFYLVMSPQEIMFSWVFLSGFRQDSSKSSREGFRCLLQCLLFAETQGRNQAPPLAGRDTLPFCWALRIFCSLGSFSKASLRKVETKQGGMQRPFTMSSLCSFFILIVNINKVFFRS